MRTQTKILSEESLFPASYSNALHCPTRIRSVGYKSPQCLEVDAAFATETRRDVHLRRLCCTRVHSLETSFAPLLPSFPLWNVLATTVEQGLIPKEKGGTVKSKRFHLLIETIVILQLP